MNLTRLLSRASAPLAAILLLLAVAACSNPGRDALDRASAVIDEHPDSAYAILAAVDPATLRNEADSALYALRWTQALYKTYRDSMLTSDTLILTATDHYSTLPVSKEKAEAFYYAGVLHMKAKKYGMAGYELLQAKEYADREKPDLLQGLILRETGDYLFATLDYDGAVHSYTQALDRFRKTDATAHADHVLTDIARSHYCRRDYLKADSVLDMALNTETSHGDPTFNAECTRLKGWVALADGRPADAIRHLTESLSEYGGPASADDYNRLGEAYLLTGNHEAARQCMEAAESIEPDNHTMRLNLDRNEGRQEEALSLIDHLIEDQNNFVLRLHADNGSDLIAKHYADAMLKREVREAEARNMRERIIWILLVLVTAAAIMIYRLHDRHRKSRLDLLMFQDQLKQEIERLRGGLSADVFPADRRANSYHAHNTSVLLNYYFNIEKTISEGKSKSSDGDGEADTARKSLLQRLLTSNRHDSKVKSHFKSKPFREESVSIANIITDGLVDRICDIDSTLAKRRTLVALLILGFSVKGCGFILEIPIHTLYSQHRVLLQRLHEHDTGLYREYCRFVSI